MMQTSNGTQDRLDHRLWQQIDMMRNPTRWPFRHWLPLRNDVRRDPSGFALLGLLYDAAGHSGHQGLQTTVFLVNLLDLGTVIKTVVQFLEQPHQTYGSVEAILADGWRVD